MQGTSRNIVLNPHAERVFPPGDIEFRIEERTPMRERKKRKIKDKRPVVKRGMASSAPELLAPAGNLETFFAALEGGADALYLGLPRFNARMRAENFSLPDFSRIIPEAHRKGVKVYVVMNSVIFEKELAPFIDLVERIKLFTPDGLILSDLGAIEIIRHHFPSVEIHGSTMMGSINSRILNVLASRGAQRVILERHMEYQQLQDTVRRSPIDIEIFVHGAMCFSYSGKCFFSSFLGGKSGNRGECVQPCRRVYRDLANEKEAPYFSARDLSLMGILPELLTLGVKAFKIEGRMRNAEYVYQVVRAYRRAMDEILDGRAEEGVALGKELLQRVAGREETGGLLSGRGEEGTVSSESGGSVGTCLGTIGDVKIPYAAMEGSGVVKKGERLRVQSSMTGQGTGFTLRDRVERGGKVWIKIPFEVKRGDSLFLVGGGMTRKKWADESIARVKVLPREGISFQVEIEGDSIRVRGKMGILEKSYSFRVSGAVKESKLPPGKKIEELLRDSYGGEMPAGKISVRGNFQGVVAPGDLVHTFKKASKSFDKLLYLELKKKRVEIISSLKVRRGEGRRKPRVLYLALSSPEEGRNLPGEVDYVVIDLTKNLARNAGRLSSLEREKIFLRLPALQSDISLTFFRGVIKKLVQRGFKKFLIPDVGWIRVFQEARVAELVEILSDYYLYSFNTASCIYLQSLGISRFILPLESTLKNIRDEGKYLKGLGIFPLYVKVPLLVSPLSASPLAGEKVVESKMEERFRVFSGEKGTTIYGEEAFSASGYIEEISRAGVNAFLVDLRSSGNEEGKEVLKMIFDDKIIPGTSAFNLLRGNV